MNTPTTDTYALSTTLKERNIARLHHVVEGAFEATGDAITVAGGAVAAVVVVAGGAALAFGGGAGAAASLAFSGAAAGGAAASVLAANSVANATREHKDNIPEREQRLFQRIGAACLISFSLAAGGITGKLVYNTVEDLQSQNAPAVVQALTPLVQQFSI